MLIFRVLCHSKFKIHSFKINTMIDSITLTNFFSFKEQTVCLNPKVNLLVGINGSGKSNFIRAFELFRYGINEASVKEKIRIWGGTDKVARFSNDDDEVDVFNVYINIKNTFLTGNYDKLVYGISYFKNDEGVYNYLDEQVVLYEGKKDNVIFERELKGEQLLDVNVITGNQTLETLEHFLKQLIVYDQINVSASGVLKSNEASRSNGKERLGVNFQNLVPLIYSFKRQPETKEIFDKIQSALTKVNVNLGDINFKVDNGILNMYINDRKKQLLLSLESISSGTLKFLTLMSILYNPNRGSVVCIEEPEDGLHPDMINTVAEGIKYAAQDSQMIISTHSPFLLNAFELEDILVFENDKNNNTVVTELSQKDFGEWKQDFTAGQAWLNGLIGGTRW